MRRRKLRHPEGDLTLGGIKFWVNEEIDLISAGSPS